MNTNRAGYKGADGILVVLVIRCPAGTISFPDHATHQIRYRYCDMRLVVLASEFIDSSSVTVVLCNTNDLLRNNKCQ